MKRNLILIFLYLIEIIFVTLFLIPSSKEAILGQMPALETVWNGYKDFMMNFLNWIHLRDFLVDYSSRINIGIAAILFNLLFLIVYELIAWICALIYQRIHKKTLEKNGLQSYALSEEEKAKFEWKLYVKKFSWLGLISFLIPLFFVTLFIFIRFDKELCLQDPLHEGFFTIYQYQIAPFLGSIDGGILVFIENTMNTYYQLMKQVIDILGMQWVEYAIVAVGIIFIFLIWWFFVSIFKRIFRSHNAKKRAKKAKRKYIARMEQEELKARKNSEKRISSKAEEILGVEQENIALEDASMIANVESSGGALIHVNEKEASYIDDISTRVVDLGVAIQDEEQEPIAERIPIFVGDEEVDIQLENEQVIEVVEEEEQEDVDEEADPFFERYRPENIDTSYLDESLLNTQIEVYEEDEMEVQEDDFIGIKDYEEKETTLEKEEKIEVVPEENKEETAIVLQEEKEPVETSEIPVPEEKEDVAAIKEELEEEKEEVKEETTVVVEEKPKEVKKIVPIAIKKTEPLPTKEEKEEAPIIKPIRVSMENKKKIRPIGPITINHKYNDKNRFQNAKSKYLDVMISKQEELKQRDEEKKRQKIRRSKNKA